MDGSRFDALTRSFAASGSRRRLLRGLIAGVIGLVGIRETAAGATCRDGGATCRESANCCSGVCLPKNAQGRRLCQPSPTTTTSTTVRPTTSTTTSTTSTTSTTTTTVPPTTSTTTSTTSTTTSTTTTTATTAVPFASTCQAGQDFCTNRSTPLCNTNCLCFTTVGGKPFCGDLVPNSCVEANECTTDAECVGKYGAGHWCANTGDQCCPTALTICVGPCAF
jgi:hypothetical protein